MSGLEWNIANVAHVIDIAIAPVFLLAGISGLLMVLTNRLGRSIDRSRSLQAAESEFLPEHHSKAIEDEMVTLVRRIRLSHTAIGLAVISAILVCLVIITLFLGNLVSSNVSVFIAVLFIICMSFLSLAFLASLIEVLIATRTRSLKASLVHSATFRGTKRDSQVYEAESESDS